ncbi:L-rhamnose isomerase [Sporolactobacillus shoreicorticis]|uniref:L-rhamnose isomerase n=1 Tax=Sporolactobacillus shoreicorticis TaxID=1923877 RepID=A0ABW5S6Y6_9BACL|nr:L-rhamnose isomerase [Sporolactobacillus shoreicorticis]MCO7124340.1 L-rhamnose isomerase [Sporolactobacillus shoreicorticis]
MSETITKSYELAKERYAEIGVDTDKAINALKNVKLSIHCWQGDDVLGFLFPNQDLTGGISVSGNYPGRAKTADQLRKDLSEALSVIPGKHKVQLHSIYADTDEKVDLNELEPKHFQSWVDWAKQEGVGLDMNGTFFSHPKSASGFTLASADKEIRDFWIEVGKGSRKIAEYFGKELGQQSVNNFWIPDGYKDNPIDKLSPRLRLVESLDEILKEKIDEAYTIEAVEGKLFGTGVESYTVGSHEFYEAYALTRGKLWTIDAGHFHPTEDVSDKFSAFLPFGKGLMLHVSRPVRWDSDHVVIFDDALTRIARALVRDDLLDKTNIGLDFFDATINRLAAWVVGSRSTLKALLQAFLAPINDLKKAELEGNYTMRLAVTEELKSYPFGAVWDYYCQESGVPVGTEWLKEIVAYEKDVLLKR